MPKKNERYSEEFKKLVNEILIRHGVDGKPLSSHAVSKLSYKELTHVMVLSFADGYLPMDPDKIRTFADVLNEPRVPLLKSSGLDKYRPFQEDYENDRVKNLLPYKPLDEDWDEVTESESADSPPTERNKEETTFLSEDPPLLTALRQLFGPENVSRYRPPAIRGYASAGTQNDVQLEFPREYEGPELFRVVITGDSMSHGYEPGDNVLFTEASQARDGDDIVAVWQDNIVFKRYRSRSRNGKKKIELESLNGKSVDTPNLLPSDQVQVLGKAEFILSPKDEVVSNRIELANLRDENARLLARLDALMSNGKEGAK